jgi:amino acid transporter
MRWLRCLRTNSCSLRWFPAGRKRNKMSNLEEDAALREFGYKQRLDRSVSKFSSFSVGFALISATTAVYAGFGLGLVTAGPAFIWTLPLAVLIFGLWAAIAADLASKIPLSGYAYQWTSRLVSPTLGWFTGYIGLAGFITGMTGVSYTFATYFTGLLGLDWGTRAHLGVTACVLLTCVLINVFGVRLATFMNNIGVGLEVLVTVGGTLVVAVFVLLIERSGQSVDYLFSHGGVTESPYVLAWLTSSLACIFGLIGVEAAADIAEETKDARRVIPRTMGYALAAAVVVETFMYVVFLLATGDPDEVASSSAPIETIMSTQVSPMFAKIVVAIALTNILACVLANMLVATRLLYAMSRDNMTPFAAGLQRVSAEHKVPVTAIWTVGGIAGLVIVSALFSETAFAYILGMATLGFFGVYILTTAGLIYANRAGRFPDSTPGTFDLGRYRTMVHTSGMICFLAVGAALLLLPDFRPNVIPFAVVVGAAFLWWAFVLRGRLNRRQAGPRAAREPSEDLTVP